VYPSFERYSLRRLAFEYCYVPGWLFRLGGTVCTLAASVWAGILLFVRRSDTGRGLYHSKLAIDFVNRQTAKQLRVEVRGFLGHHTARKGHFSHLFHRCRLEEKRDLSLLFLNLGAGGVQTSNVFQMFLLANRFFADTQHVPQ